MGYPDRLQVARGPHSSRTEFSPFVYLLQIIRQAPVRARRRLLLYAAVSGASSAASLGLALNAAQATARSGEVEMSLLLPFALMVTVYLYVGYVAQCSTNNLVQRAVHRIRMSLLAKLCRAGLREIEGLGRGRLFTRMADGTNAVSMEGPMVGAALQQLLTLTCALLYLCWLSVYAFGLVVSLLIVGGVLFALRRLEFETSLERIAQARSRLFDLLGHILRGGREIRLDHRRNEALFEAFRSQGATIENDALLRARIANMPLVYADFMLYTLMGALVFVLPVVAPPARLNLTEIQSACLFLLGPLAYILTLVPYLAEAESALRRLDELECQLEPLAVEPVDPLPLEGEPTQISWQDVTFSYTGAEQQPLFTSGPFSLDLAHGDLVFVVGGNGSGKSTLLKLITGLYPADSGTIRVDATPLERRHMQGLRELFGAIFPDCYLFDRLYGVDDPDAAEVNGLIERFGLASKVSFANGGFSHIKLSTGQRKRLALIELLLEDRPFIILDEWAADQDGEFRARFYTEILPDLKRRGKTIVAVTHDDRWFKAADRVVKLDLGRVVSVTANAAAS